MCGRDVSLLRKSSDIFLTSKALVRKGVSDANDAPATRESSEKVFSPFILNQNDVSSVKISTTQQKGKTKCVKVLLPTTHLDQ